MVGFSTRFGVVVAEAGGSSLTMGAEGDSDALLLEDGSSELLLEDGSSELLLEEGSEGPEEPTSEDGAADGGIVELEIDAEEYREPETEVKKEEEREAEKLSAIALVVLSVEK